MKNRSIKIGILAVFAVLIACFLIWIFILLTPTGSKSEFEKYASSENVPTSLDERFEYLKNHARYVGDTRASNSVDNVGELLQYPELSDGCESVSATIVLRAHGFDIDKTCIWDNYLDKADDYSSNDPTKFAHNYAAPPAIVKAVNLYLNDQNSKLLAFELTGTSFETLCSYIDEGYPIIIWVTSDMELPTVRYTYGGYPLYWPEHCVVLYDYDIEEDIAYVSDPQYGLVERDLTDFADIYEQCGNMAVIIM